MRKLLSLCMIASIIFITPSVFASAGGSESVETPASIKGATIINAAKVKELLDSGNLKVVDPRKKIEYMESHIPGALSVTYKGKSPKVEGADLSGDTFQLEKAIPNKSTPIVMYCNGVKCWKSYKAIVYAQQHGYTNLYWFRNGLPEWKAAGYSVE